MRAIWSAKRFNCAQCIVVNNNATRDVTREAILLIPVHIRIRNNTAIFRQFYGNFADFLSIWTVSERAWNKCLPICIGNITATFPAFCIWTRLLTYTPSGARRGALKKVWRYCVCHNFTHASAIKCPFISDKYRAFFFFMSHLSILKT